MKTTTPSVLENQQRGWYIVDAQGMTLGRLATAIATVIHGKHKPTFSSHLDQGDYVIVLNADKFTVTGKKMTDKMYYTHSMYLGNLYEQSLEKLLQSKPTDALSFAVSGMLPKNKLRSSKLARLKMYTGTEHPHEAQKPQPLHV